MNDLARPVTEPLFIDGRAIPSSATFTNIGNALRAGRPMPQRADIDPGKIPKLLPYILMYTVVPDGVTPFASLARSGELCRA